MKIIKKIMFLLLSPFLLISCMDYLERTPEANITEKDVFGTYEDFQGFIDPVYRWIFNYSAIRVQTQNQYYGNDLAPLYETCDWRSIIEPPTAYQHWDEKDDAGYWISSWRAIRIMNLGLKNFHLLEDATEEEKNWILGQIYFFRAFFHGEVIKFYGGMPYIDRVLEADELIREKRLTYRETALKIVEDLERAIPLLPQEWHPSQLGRVTKGAAMAYKQHHLLYAASPLMSLDAGGTPTYNIELCKRAAEAGWEMIDYCQKTGAHELTPFDKITDMYFTVDNTNPWTKETLLQMTLRQRGIVPYNLARWWVPNMVFGGLGTTPTVNQLFIDKYEMADGTRYKVEYDNDDDKRWNNRDPRFRKFILVDRDRHGNHPNAIIRLWSEGPTTSERVGDRAIFPYLCKKWWAWGVSVLEGNTNTPRYAYPRMRLANVYLDYAEAVTVAYGPDGFPPGSNMSAVDAINIIRARAGMPPVTSEATGYKDFMELVRNERNVELFAEARYWYDVRRWYIAHEPEQTTFINLLFDENWTYFNRITHAVQAFQQSKHYWFPLMRRDVTIYSDWKQNPGW